jgi:hypothetical protein
LVAWAGDHELEMKKILHNLFRDRKKLFDALLEMRRRDPMMGSHETRRARHACAASSIDLT